MVNGAWGHDKGSGTRAGGVVGRRRPARRRPAQASCPGRSQQLCGASTGCERQWPAGSDRGSGLLQRRDALRPSRPGGISRRHDKRANEWARRGEPDSKATEPLFVAPALAMTIRGRSPTRTSTSIAASSASSRTRVQPSDGFVRTRSGANTSVPNARQGPSRWLRSPR